jgi:hypothetical protein
VEQKWIRYIFSDDWENGDWLEYSYPTEEDIKTEAEKDEITCPIVKIEITAVTLDLEK